MADIRPPVVSVVVPVYNVEAYVTRCLDSIRAQTLREIEIIVIDDGSTDGSAALISSQAARDPRIHAISQANGGLSAARNSGLDAARGEFVAFVDSDDYIDADMLRTLVDIARRESADVVQCGIRRVNEAGQAFAIPQMIPPFTFERMLNGELFRAAWNKLYRRDLFERHAIRFPLQRLHEDLGVSCQLYYHARKIAWCQDNFYNWFSRAGSISQAISEQHVRDVFATFRELADFLRAEGVHERYFDPYRHGCMVYAANLQDRINKLRGQHEAERVRLLRILGAELEGAGFAGAAMAKWLGKIDPQLYVRFYGNGVMDEELAKKSREELIAELKRAQMALYMRELGGDEYQAHVNLEFNVHINRLYEWLGRYRKQYPRIALYGNSVVGRLLARELGDALVVVADQSAATIQDCTYPLCIPEQLADYTFDCVIICVMGREPGIRKYLHEVAGVPAYKILSFDLAHDLPQPDRYLEDARNLTGRIARGEPIIGHHPLNVQIQTVSTCNANCYFCPYVGSWHQKNPGRMDDALYRKIVDQLARYRIKKFCPYFDEPFLDKHLFERIQYAVDVLKPETVEISSNLSVLLDRHIEGLVNVLAKVPHEFRISFHGIDKQSYERIMELDYEKTLRNVHTVVGLMQYTPLNVLIRGAGEPRRGTDSAERWFGEVEFRQFWQDQLAGYRVRPRLNYFTYHDRAGQSQLKSRGLDFNAQRRDLTDFYCNRFDRWVHFLYTGEPILCCMDYNRETVFAGSAKEMSVEELFNSPAFVQMIKEGTGMCESKPDHICKRCISPGG